MGSTFEVVNGPTTVPNAPYKYGEREPLGKGCIYKVVSGMHTTRVPSVGRRCSRLAMGTEHLNPSYAYSG